MNRRLVLVQTIVFAVVAVTVIVYSLFALTDVKVVNKPYHVTVELAGGGGLFDGSEVTYRGIRIGSVTEVDLEPDQVIATLAIDHDEEVPKDVVATVARLSAAGEQYIDLVSDQRGGPYLAEGDIIPRERTVLPPETATVLSDIESLVTSIDPAELRILSRELALAVGGSRDDLATIVNSSSALLEELEDSPERLRRILDNSSVLLETAADHRSDLSEFSGSLRVLSRTLRRRTPELTQILEASSELSTLTTRIIDEHGEAFSLLFADLADFGHLQSAYVPGWRALVPAISQFIDLAPLAIRDDAIWANVVFNYTQPLCSFTDEMTSPLSRDRTPLRTVSCPSPAPGTLQRGAQNAPR